MWSITAHIGLLLGSEKRNFHRTIHSKILSGQSSIFSSTTLSISGHFPSSPSLPSPLHLHPFPIFFRADCGSSYSTMLKYQLIGRKKVAGARKKGHSYPPLHLCLLPYEILVYIFSCLQDTAALLSLAATCTKLNTILLKNFIYRRLVFSTPARFTTFALAHLPVRLSLARRFSSNEPSGKINFITAVHLVNPPTYTPGASTQIAGSYSVDTLDLGAEPYQLFEKCLRSLLNEAYGLREVRISEISPQFQFSPDYASSGLSALKARFKSPKQARQLDSLILLAQSGWTIPFHLSLLLPFAAVFDRVSALHLQNFAINESKLAAELLSQTVVIDSLLLSACILAPSKKMAKRKCISLFADTSSLGLAEIQHGADLCFIDLIKANDKLRKLTINIGSEVFYHLDCTDNTKKFNFAKYNNFFRLVCSGEGGYASLKEVVLTNFDLFHAISHRHEPQATLAAIQEEDEDAEEVCPTDTFEYFLKCVGAIPNLSIVLKEAPKVMHTCKNCGFTVEEETKNISSLRSSEWTIILESVLANPNCSVAIYDFNLRPLFSRKALA